MKNGGAMFSRHRPGDEKRLADYSRVPFGTVMGNISKALSKLSPGHRIPVYPPARARFLTGA